MNKWEHALRVFVEACEPVWPDTPRTMTIIITVAGGGLPAERLLRPQLQALAKILQRSNLTVTIRVKHDNKRGPFPHDRW